MTEVEDDGRFADRGRVVQRPTDGVDTAFEGTNHCSGTRVACQLAVVVTSNAQYKTVAKFATYRPLEMEFIAGLVIGCLVFEVVGESGCPIELQLSPGFIGPGDRQTAIDAGAIEANDWGEPLLISASRRNRLQPDRVGQIPILPAKLHARHHIAEAPAINLARRG
jgi:hypothetical protein